MEHKQGAIAEIIYYNKENCYAILVMENDEEQFTAVGYLPQAEKGRRFSFEGVWKTHPQYGEQFAFSSFEEEMPSTAEGMEAFLVSGVIKGIGKKTAAAIIAHFGAETLQIIEQQPERLIEVEGLSLIHI